MLVHVQGAIDVRAVRMHKNPIKHTEVNGIGKVITLRVFCLSTISNSSRPHWRRSYLPMAIQPLLLPILATPLNPVKVQLTTALSPP